MVSEILDLLWGIVGILVFVFIIDEVFWDGDLRDAILSRISKDD